MKKQVRDEQESYKRDGEAKSDPFRVSRQRFFPVWTLATAALNPANELLLPYLEGPRCPGALASPAPATVKLLITD